MHYSKMPFFLSIVLSLSTISTAHYVPHNWPSAESIVPTPTTAATELAPTSAAGDSPDTTTTTAATSSPTTPSSSGTYTGDITHYEVGLGSCGTTNTDSQAVCALSVAMMANGPNPNTNPKCQTTITLFNPITGSSTQATVVDTCQACAYEDVDLSPSLFETVAPTGDGRVHNINWSFN